MTERPIELRDDVVRMVPLLSQLVVLMPLSEQPRPFATDDAGTPCDVYLRQVGDEPTQRVAMGRDGVGVLTEISAPCAVGDVWWLREEHFLRGMTDVRAPVGHREWFAGVREYADSWDDWAIDFPPDWRPSDDMAVVETGRPEGYADPWKVYLRTRTLPPERMERWVSRFAFETASVETMRLSAIPDDAVADMGIPRVDGVYVGRRGPGRCMTPWPTAREAMVDIWEAEHGRCPEEPDPFVFVVRTLGMLTSAEGRPRIKETT